MKSSLILLLLLAGLSAPAVLAAEPKPSPAADTTSAAPTGPRPRPARPLPRLAETLQLSDEQKAAIGPIVRAWREEVRALAERHARERRQLFQKMLEQVRPKLDDTQRALLDERLQKARQRLRNRLGTD